MTVEWVDSGSVEGLRILANEGSPAFEAATDTGLDIGTSSQQMYDALLDSPGFNSGVNYPAGPSMGPVGLAQSQMAGFDADLAMLTGGRDAALQDYLSQAALIEPTGVHAQPGYGGAGAAGYGATEGLWGPLSGLGRGDQLEWLLGAANLAMQGQHQVNEQQLFDEQATLERLQAEAMAEIESGDINPIEAFERLKALPGQLQAEAARMTELQIDAQGFRTPWNAEALTEAEQAMFEQVPISQAYDSPEAMLAAFAKAGITDLSEIGQRMGVPGGALSGPTAQDIFEAATLERFGVSGQNPLQALGVGQQFLSEALNASMGETHIDQAALSPYSEYQVAAAEEMADWEDIAFENYQLETGELRPEYARRAGEAIGADPIALAGRFPSLPGEMAQAREDHQAWQYRQETGFDSPLEQVEYMNAVTDAESEVTVNDMAAFTGFHPSDITEAADKSNTGLSAASTLMGGPWWTQIHASVVGTINDYGTDTAAAARELTSTSYYAELFAGIADKYGEEYPELMNLADITGLDKFVSELYLPTLLPPEVGF